jgi:L-alanine-DL-glutamate epimerase-like enolase superfamily enzyme
VAHIKRLIEHRRMLAIPTANDAGNRMERRSLLVAVEHQGQIGLGEAAPLPGHSRDTFDEAHRALRALGGQRLSSVCDRRLPASACAAIDAAMFDAASRIEGKPARELLPEYALDSNLPDPEPSEMPVSLRLPERLDAALDAARAARSHGIHCFEIGIAPGSDAGLATLSALRREHGDSISLRANAARSFTRAELERKVPELRELSLEWLEEPTVSPLDSSLGLPLALDASHCSDRCDFAKRESELGVVAFLVKQMVQHGLIWSNRIFMYSRWSQIAGVASHTFEGPVGFMTNALLAFSFGPRFAHDLAPHVGLGTVRPPALHRDRNTLVPWTEPGFGLDIETALAGAEIVSDEGF